MITLACAMIAPIAFAQTSTTTTEQTTTPRQFPYPVIGVPEITETTEIEPVTAPSTATTTTTEEQHAIEAATVDVMATQTLPIRERRNWGATLGTFALMSTIAVSYRPTR